MLKRLILFLVLAVGVGGVALHVTGNLPESIAAPIEKLTGRKSKETAQPAAHRAAEDNSAAATPRVSVVPARVRTLTERVLITGTIVPRREVFVAPEVANLRVRSVKADAGDRVEKGQVLVTLVTEGLDAQLAQATAAIASANAAIARAEREVTRAKSQADQARRDLERTQKLAARGVVSDSTRDQRETAFATARAQLAAAEADRTRAKADKAQAMAKRRELVWNRDNAKIRAPEAGIVLERNIEEGALPIPGAAPMFKIAVDGELELEGEVFEADLALVKPGQPASISPTFGGPLSGRVRMIMPQIDRATRLGKVRIRLESKTDLKVGSFARARIVVDEANAIAIPRSAIMFEGDKAYVYIAKDGKVARRDVTLSISENGMVAVRAGLESGARVIAKAGTFLRPGDEIIPVDAEPVKLTGAR